MVMIDEETKKIVMYVNGEKKKEQMKVLVVIAWIMLFTGIFLFFLGVFR